MPDNPKNRVDITVEVVYSPGHSVSNRLFYIYFIAMTNTGSSRAKLLRRHFLIRDGAGMEHEVDGEGVVGEFPVLEPGETYRYHSGVPIARPPGEMRGFYSFENADGEKFNAQLPLFTLYEPPGYVSPVDDLDQWQPDKNRIIN